MRIKGFRRERMGGGPKAGWEVQASQVHQEVLRGEAKEIGRLAYKGNQVSLF